MEARWVESNRVSFIIEYLNILKLGRVRLIIPDPNRFVSRGSCNELFLEANVHTGDRPPMEGTNQILIVSIVLRSLQILV